jgi:hypothetical protein
MIVFMHLGSVGPCNPFNLFNLFNSFNFGRGLATRPIRLTRPIRPTCFSAFLSEASFKTRKPILQPRINRFAFQGQHPKYSFMHTPQWLFAHEPLQCFDTQRELAQCQ